MLNNNGSIFLSSDQLTTSRILQPEQMQHDISFRIAEKEIILLKGNGDIYVNGNLIENDKDVIDALRLFLKVSNQGGNNI